MANEHLNSLIEKRRILANKNEISKKLQVIVKSLGKPIVEQITSYNLLPNFWEIDAPEILEADDENIIIHGYYFDGLSRGINLTIKMTEYEEFLTEIRANYNGYQVFLETEGEIKSYAPFNSWEDAVNRLYGYAKKNMENKIVEKQLEIKESNKQTSMSILEKLRLLWGI